MTWYLFQLAIREEISQMSIEEILALKEKIGSKIFDQKMGFSKKKSLSEKEKFKRENKNRPRLEPISKKPVNKKMDHIVGVKAEHRKDVRDPRFDPLCGTFDDKVFKTSYKFVDEIKEKELKELKTQLKSEEDPEKIEQIQYLIQRMVKKLSEKFFKILQ